jgi:hypothetical protein
VALLTRRGPRAPAGPVWLLALLLGAPAAAFTATEYEVKAAYLYNFARFVEWPRESLGAPDAPFVVGVLGEDPFGDVLDKTMAGKRVWGHPVAVRRLDDPEDAARCHMLFVSASERDRLRTIVKAASQSTLTVGETDEFARVGGMITFRVDERRVRFQINPARAGQARLKVSSQLLKLATIVPEE